MAAADYAQGEGEPPPELRKAFACQFWHCLPRAGGYDDQPAGLMNRITMAWNVYDAFQGFAHAENAVDWAAAHPDAPKLMQWVEELRENK
jgi:hypothetical protein